MECLHNFEMCEREKTIGEQRFPFKTKACTKCNEFEWNSAHEAEYKNWVNSLPDHVFTVQGVCVDESVKRHIERELKERHPKADLSSAVRAALAVYLYIVVKNEKASSITEHAYGEWMRVRPRLEQTSKHSIRLSRELYIMARDEASLMDMTLPKFVSEAVARVFAVVTRRVREQEEDTANIESGLHAFLSVA